MEEKRDMIRHSDIKERKKGWDQSRQLEEKIKRREDVIDRYREACRKYEALCESYREENAKLLKTVESMLRVQEQKSQEYQKIFNDVAWTLQSMLGKEKAGKDVSYEKDKIRQRLREGCLETTQKKEPENYSYFLTGADTLLLEGKDLETRPKENLKRYRENQERQKKVLEKYKKYRQDLEKQRLKQQRQTAFQNAAEILMAFFLQEGVSDESGAQKPVDLLLEEKTGICFRYRDDPEMTAAMREEFLPCGEEGICVPGIFVREYEDRQNAKGRLVRYGTNVGYYAKE